VAPAGKCGALRAAFAAPPLGIYLGRCSPTESPSRSRMEKTWVRVANVPIRGPFG
jgi:hypothetical protein